MPFKQLGVEFIVAKYGNDILNWLGPDRISSKGRRTAKDMLSNSACEKDVLQREQKTEISAPEQTV